MKKRVLGIALTAAMVMSLAACGSSSSSASSSTSESTAETEAETEAAAEGSTADVEGVQADDDFYAQADLSQLDGKKIGVTIQSLQNAYWAGVMSALQEVVEENGGEINIVACDDNSAKQISQIENFVSSGVDLIMVHPSDANAVEDACKEAMDAGIKVMCWDDPMTNTDANWILNNTDLGIAIGDLAGDFINEHYDEDNKAQVALIDYNSTKVLLERANGIKEGLEETCPGKYEIVAEQDGLEANEAQTSMETILQAHPDCKVAVGVGAGAMIGSSEALSTSVNGEIPDDMGVFTTDVTKQQLELIQDPTSAARAIIGFEGSDEDTATACASMYALILGDQLDEQNVYRQVAPIDESNIDEIMKGMK